MLGDHGKGQKRRWRESGVPVGVTEAFDSKSRWWGTNTLYVMA